MDLFEDLECEVEDVFVFEMNCIGWGLNLFMCFFFFIEVIIFVIFVDVLGFW